MDRTIEETKQIQIDQLIAKNNRLKELIRADAKEIAGLHILVRKLRGKVAYLKGVGNE